MASKSSERLDLERDIFPFLRRWRLVGAWGDVTIRFKQGQPIDIMPHPIIQNIHDMQIHLPRMPREMEPMAP